MGGDVPDRRPVREAAGVRLLFDMQGKLVRTETIPQGSTIWYGCRTRTTAPTVEVTSGNERWRKPVVVALNLVQRVPHTLHG
jgi:hypothetical protein